MRYLKAILSVVILTGFINVNAYADAKGGSYGNKGSGVGKPITVLIKQVAKGAICPRAIKGSSVTKIACDHFEITSKYGSYIPAIKAGAYREMIQSNSATHKTLDM